MGSASGMTHFFIHLLHLPQFSHVASAEQVLDLPVTSREAPSSAPGDYSVRKKDRALRSFFSRGGDWVAPCDEKNKCKTHLTCRSGFCDQEINGEFCLAGGKKLDEDSGKEYKKEATPKGLDCQTVCAIDSECEFFTWNKVSKKCFMFHEESEAQDDPNSVSAHKACEKHIIGSTSPTTGAPATKPTSKESTPEQPKPESKASQKNTKPESESKAPPTTRKPESESQASQKYTKAESGGEASPKPTKPESGSGASPDTPKSTSENDASPTIGEPESESDASHTTVEPDSESD